MKRIAWLVAVPVGLALVWGAGSARTPARSAEVALTTDQVSALRTSVIARLQALGAERIGEHTTFDGQGAAELDFQLPTAKIEESLTVLGQLGATVTDQRVAVQTASADQPLAERLDRLQSCLSDVSEAVPTRSANATRSELGACRDRLRQTAADAASALPPEATLRVTISPVDASSPWMAVTFVALLFGGVFACIAMVRARTASKAIDLRLDEQLSRTDELFLRRN